jgi:hypothetical protein
MRGQRRSARLCGTVGSEVHGYSDVEINGSREDQIVAIKGQLRSITDAVIAHDKKMIKLEKETEKGFERERSERERGTPTFEAKSKKWQQAIFMWI